MSPDEHLVKAEDLLAKAVEPDRSPERASVLMEAACLHTNLALLAQRPQLGTVWHECTTDSMMKFTPSEGLDDIRDWHADAAPKADRLDDFDAWLHVRDVGKLLDHIDHQDMALTLEGGARDRQRAKAGEATQQALQYKAALTRLVAEIKDLAGNGSLSYLPEPLQRALAEAETFAVGGPVPSTGEDTGSTATSNLARHARRELELCGQYEEDPEYSDSIIAAVEAFASFGHSGGSAMVARGQLHKLLGFETLSPLTSDPDEWIDQSEASGVPMWQSRRNPAVFSSDGGKTWWHLDDEKPSAPPTGEDQSAKPERSCSRCGHDENEHDMFQECDVFGCCCGLFTPVPDEGNRDDAGRPVPLSGWPYDDGSRD